MPAKKRHARKHHAKKPLVKKHHANKRQALGSRKRTSKRSPRLVRKTAAPKKRRPIQKSKITPGPSPKAVRTSAQLFALMAAAPSPSLPPKTNSPSGERMLQSGASRPRY